MALLVSLLLIMTIVLWNLQSLLLNTNVMGQMNLVDKAQQLALTAHFGHKNAHDSEPYVLHLQRVYIAVRDAGLDEIHQAVAWLHDSLEDTDLTPDDIIKELGYGQEAAAVCSGVMSMTKARGGKETNERYYMRVKNNPVAAAVKIHDLHDNFGRNHLIEDDETRLRMAKKYSLGIDMLTRS